MAEPAMTSISELAEAITDAVAQLPERPFALFGHSMGAVLASEVARSLAARSLSLPSHLIVSGRPHLSSRPKSADRRSAGRRLRFRNQPAIWGHSQRNLSAPRRSRAAAARSARRHHRARNVSAWTEIASSNTHFCIRRGLRSDDARLASPRVEIGNPRRLRVACFSPAATSISTRGGRRWRAKLCA